jgi:biopolymer transport protein ExbB/TolQ
MEHSNSYGVASFLAQSDAVGIGVLLILLTMSIASWYLIVLKTIRGRQLRRQVREFLDSFWSAPSIDVIAAQLSQQTRQDPFARVVAQGIEASRHYRKSATAGLAVAIPAVLAYNAFTRANRVVLAELDGFAHDLHAFLITGAKLDSGGFMRTMPKPLPAAMNPRKVVA